VRRYSSEEIFWLQENLSRVFLAMLLYRIKFLAESSVFVLSLAKVCLSAVDLDVINTTTLHNPPPHKKMHSMV